MGANISGKSVMLSIFKIHKAPIKEGRKIFVYYRW